MPLRPRGRGSGSAGYRRGAWVNRMSEARIWHGGDLDEARRLFPDAPQPFIDLSTGINPNPYPVPTLPQDAFARLPQPDAGARLAAIAAAAYGASHAACVVAAPGSQLLLPLVAQLAAPGLAAILGPTYQEHARAAALAGHRVREINDASEAHGAVLVIVTNPNNPDGRVFSKSAL